MHDFTSITRSALRKWLCAVAIAGLLYLAAPELGSSVFAQESEEAVAVTIVNTINQLRLLVVLVSSGIATLFFTWGAAQYMMASGSPQQMESGKSTMRGSVVGLILVFLAVAIVGFVANALETTTGQDADPTSFIWPSAWDGVRAGVSSAMEWTRAA